MSDVTRHRDFGFVHLDPIPTEAEVEEYYQSEFYARANASHVNDSSLQNLDEEAEYHRRSYEDLLDVIERFCLKPSGRTSLRVADIGSGYGHFLQFLGANGLDGYGIEPVIEGVVYGKSLGVEVFQCGVEDLATPPGGQVDLVTMLNVLEHLRDPMAVLQSFRDSWIKPGGFILLRVPNDFNAFQVAANDLHGLDEWWVAPPRHINYFSHESLSHLVEGTGFDVRYVTSTFPLEMFLLMGDVYVGNNQLGKEIHRKRVVFERSLDETGNQDLRRAFYHSLSQIGLGREIVLLAQRSS
jgi:SAM-dependent methyltransferase